MSGKIEIPVSKEHLGEALGRVTSGVYIITAESKQEKAGMLASWVMQAGFQPPMLSAAMSADRELYQLIQQTGRFTVNVISKQNGPLMKAFSHYQPDQFDQVAWRSTYCGLVLKDSVAYMDCIVKGQVDTGADHRVLVAEIVDGSLLNTDLEPMSHLRKTGFSY